MEQGIGESITNSEIVHCGKVLCYKLLDASKSLDTQFCHFLEIDPSAK